MSDIGKQSYGKVLFSKRVPGEGKTYFIDVKESENTGKKYLVMAESRKMDGVWKRFSVVLFPERAEEWRKTLDEAILYL